MNHNSTKVSTKHMPQEKKRFLTSKLAKIRSDREQEQTLHTNELTIRVSKNMNTFIDSVRKIRW